MAYAMAGELPEIRGMVSRLPRLVRSLKKFSFPLVVPLLAELLIRRENHTATARIEALIHLAALYCRGKKQPGRRQLHKWLNVLIFNDVITQLEVPVEDVFVTNVVTGFGNARLFQGLWQDNEDYVQNCIRALIAIGAHPWAAEALRHIMALLRVSEAVAERARVVRYSRTESTPREPITISVSAIAESNRPVSFTDDELLTIGVNPSYLDPFVFEGEHADLLVSQSIGHTALERQPLMRFAGQTTVMLPTAIGAAIRQFATERAALADELGVFQSACHGEQYSEVFLMGRAAWNIKFIEALKHDSDDDFREFVGTFDDGGYVHLLFVPDDFEEIAQRGLASIHELDDTIRERINYRAGRLADEPDFRRGLTILVHGGIGREFLPLWGDFPCGWHQLCLSAPEFMFLGSESEFTAMRAWKLLQQVDDLEEKGVVFPNLRGFLNLTAFAYYGDFELVPINMGLGLIYLHGDVILPLRHKVRNALDQHAAIAPNSEGWISVQRETTGAVLRETRERPVFISPGAMARQELLACVESPYRPWWIHCSKLPESAWHRDIAFHILELALGWLAQLAFLLEERLSALRTGPVTYRFRFLDIETNHST